ncbi:MAG: ABC transporter permease [Erythrobacter sp.]
MIRLAFAYLADRPLTAALNVVLLAISTAMLVLLLQFSSQANERFERDIAGIDLVVGAKGSPLQLILSSVFHVDQPTGNIPLESLTLLRRDPAVARAVPLALGDNFNGFRIVGTDASFAAIYPADMAQGRSFDTPMEAVLGAEVARRTGAQLGQKFIGSHGLADDADGDQGHDHAPFTTVGILAPTGSVVDRLILTSVDSVWAVHGIGDDHDHDHGHDHGDDHDHGHDDDHDHDHDHDHAKPDPAAPLQAARGGPEPELTALLVTYRNASAAIRLPALINRQTALQAAVPATETARLLELMGASLAGVRIFAWLLAATGGLAIFVALLAALRGREGDLALLRVMGASRREVFMVVLLEGVITAAAGALVGIIAAHGLIALAAAQFATLGDLGLAAWRIGAGEAGLLALVIAIGAGAALLPGARALKLDPARVLARA